MDDVEIIKLCAGAMGFRSEIAKDDQDRTWLLVWNGGQVVYDPLRDDAQNAELEWLLIQHGELAFDGKQMRYWPDPLSDAIKFRADTKEAKRRAVCLCVAKMEMAKREGADK